MTTPESSAEQPSPEVTPKVFKGANRSFQGAFVGFGASSIMFVPIPIAEGMSIPVEAVMPDGVYVIERSESEKEKRLEIIVTKTPLPGDDSFISETTYLTDALVEESEKREIERIRDLRLVRKLNLRFVRLDRKSAEELAREGAADQAQDAVITRVTEYKGMAALPVIEEFTERIRASNPNASRRTSRRGKT